MVTAIATGRRVARASPPVHCLGRRRLPPVAVSAERHHEVRARPRLAFGAMRVLVTGGAGFIGSHFVRRLAAAGEMVVVLDKLTYSGNPANLAGAEHEFHRGDIADADAVAGAARGCDAIVNFAAESHVDRSILGPAEFIRTDVLGTQVLLEHARTQ